MKAYNTTTQTLTLTVKALVQESTTCVSIVFSRPPDFTYGAGDWIDIGFDRHPHAGVKTFSLSSSPTEPDLMITYKTGLSDFKKRLQNLCVGDMVRVVQYGNSGFGLNRKRRATLIAGGVGIAPLRSMIKEALDTDPNAPMILLYQSRTADFPFYDELLTWSRSATSFKIEMFDSAVKGRMKKEAILKFAPPDKGSIYYIAGPPSMVENTENFLIQNGVAVKNIQDDAFTGY